MLLRPSRVLLLAAAFALPGQLWAASATGTVGVTAFVSGNCRIQSTSNVVFGAYSTVGSGVQQATGTVSLQCSKGSPIFSLDLDLGSNASGSTRRMTNGTDFIAYELYKPSGINPGDACAYTSVWGSGPLNGLVPTPSANSAPRSYNVCGQTAQGQNAGPGAYTDTVTVTVNF
jgi:spore coat protein U domain-containing protein, fimbrial subunit CupE1/2/3/6